MSDELEISHKEVAHCTPDYPNLDNECKSLKNLTELQIKCTHDYDFGLNDYIRVDKKKTLHFALSKSVKHIYLLRVYRNMWNNAILNVFLNRLEQLKSFHKDLNGD
ncbi:CLUMA_CG007939, isoform A [Clunio marinus]|uniref:CLUMA_CG007939, isoform A n=1 Tax=Clunio marinus TaxID=568069 RepID=A0A1J1I2A2_9DIPT|nr:CLUMA_CG007939, isoform A [Clunio marinus]